MKQTNVKKNPNVFVFLHVGKPKSWLGAAPERSVTSQWAVKRKKMYQDFGGDREKKMKSD